MVDKYPVCATCEGGWSVDHMWAALSEGRTCHPSTSSSLWGRPPLVVRTRCSRLDLLCASFAIALTVSAPAAQMHWVCEAVYQEKVAGDYDAVLDEQGYMHVIYGRNALYHDWEDEKGWHSEVVDTTAAPGSHDLALDSAGAPHVTYVDLLQFDVKYARRDAAGWSTETIALDACEGGGNPGPLSAICLDAADRPHVGYNAGSWESVTLKYLVKEPSGWQATTVGSWGNAELGRIAIGVAHDNLPRVACIARAGGPFDSTHVLFHTWRSALGWSSDGISIPSDYGEHVLEFDVAGRLHVAYRDEDGSGWEGVSYVLGLPGRFVTEQLFRTHNFLNLQLAVSREGVPHLIFGNNVGYAPRGLYHMSKVGSEWEQTQINEDDRTKYNATLGLDEAGQPHVYVEQTHVWQDAEGWHSEPELSGPNPDRSDKGNPRLLLAGNRLRMVYSFLPGHAIGSVVYSQDTTDWRERVLALPEPYVTGCRLVLDTRNRPHTLFESPDELAYAWRDTDGWHQASIGNQGPNSPQQESLLALDSDGNPHIGYLSGRDVPILKYAVLQNAEWNITDVETDGVSGFAMALDSDGRPHIGYVSGHLKYAVLKDTGWEVADVNTNVWTVLSMILDGMDRPHFLADESGVSVHFWKDESGWHHEVVPSPSIGSGIVVDGEGDLHTCGSAQLGEHRFSVWHGLRTPAGWQFATVAETTCDWLSVRAWALDQEDQPHIVYSTYNPGGDGLLYTRPAATGYQVHAVYPQPGDDVVLGISLAVAFADDGAPFLAYDVIPLWEEGRAPEFRCSQWTSQGVETFTLENGCFSGAVAVDSQGLPHIAYSNAGARGNRSYLYVPPFALTGLSPAADGQVRIAWQGALNGVGVDGAPLLSGPWSAVAQDLSGLEGTIGADPDLRFFRLRQAQLP